ncbi:MAG: hypothetical protein ACRDQA_15745 [Nocardioidaceae bacterium]
MILGYVNCRDPECYGVAHWRRHDVYQRTKDLWVEADEIMCPTCHRAFRVLSSSTPPDLAEFEEAL